MVNSFQIKINEKIRLYVASQFIIANRQQLITIYKMDINNIKFMDNDFSKNNSFHFNNIMLLE